jgi:P pilus assembly chaperone PapD
MTSRREFHLLLAGGSAALLLPGRAAAQAGDLNVAPKRLVFGPGLRAASVYVFNRGGAPSTYEIELVDRVMTPEGQIRSVADVADDSATAAQRERLRSARSLIAFSPRRVTLAPGESQTIRLRVQRPADLPEGEYRTHLTVTQMPPAERGVTAEQVASQRPAEAISVTLTALFSATIPVIVRNGAVPASARIANVKNGPGARNPTEGVLSFDLLREGAGSVYGDLVVRSAGAPATAAPLGELRGIGVYPEVDGRPVRVPLSRSLKPGEQVEVQFVDDDHAPGRVLASARHTAT